MRCRVVRQIKGKHRVFGTGPHGLCLCSVVAVVLMFVLKINSVGITKSQSCLWKHRQSRQRHQRGCSGLGLHWWGAQPGRGGGAAALFPSLLFTDGTVFFVLVYLTSRAQVGMRRLEVGPWRREFLGWIERVLRKGCFRALMPSSSQDSLFCFCL